MQVNQNTKERIKARLLTGHYYAMSLQLQREHLKKELYCYFLQHQGLTIDNGIISACSGT